uniref:Uncharacterized protein n=1 Tax=Nitrosopumivirus cobalaminus TaxID=3158414 RepID=A0AAU7N462_9VIRU
MVRGLSDDVKTYELIDGTVLTIKDNVSAQVYFEIMEDWTAVEETEVKTIMEQFKKDKAEREVVKKVFSTYTTSKYDKLAKTIDYRELVACAGEIFTFLGKSTNSEETLRLTKLYQDMKK